MKKVLINCGCGQSNISNNGLTTLRKKKGLETYFYLIRSDVKNISITKVTDNEHSYLIAFDRDVENNILSYDDYRKIYEKHAINTWNTLDNREDPEMIELFESDPTIFNHGDTKFKIVEIPDDVKYFIDNNDPEGYGPEVIHEEHRTWS